MVWGVAALVTLGGSGVFVTLLLQQAGKRIPEEERNPGRVIGKLENILVLVFVAAGEFTALAIIFAAKGIVRTPKGAGDASYYILGTLANFTWAVLIAGTARVVLRMLG
jgi:hypothetical protein